MFIDRGLWDKNLFDGDNSTSFYIARRVGIQPINRGSLRIDFAETISLDKLVVKVGTEHALQPFKSEEAVELHVSADLKNWTPVLILAGKDMVVDLDPEVPIRYVRFSGVPDKVNGIEGYRSGKMVDRSRWRASNLFSTYRRVSIQNAWSHSFTLNEIPKGSYLAIALEGEHGEEGAYAAVRVNGKPLGAPDRSVSYPSNAWEYPASRASSNYTYYVPLTNDMKGAQIDAVVLGLRNSPSDFKPELWITAYPIPFEQKQLTLTEVQ